MIVALVIAAYLAGVVLLFALLAFLDGRAGHVLDFRGNGLAAAFWPFTVALFVAAALLGVVAKVAHRAGEKRRGGTS